MLLVNNSPRCHLQSLFPAHFSLSGRFSLDSDWRNRGKDITCYANATGYFVASLPDSFLINLYTFFFFTTCPSSVFVWILPVFSICLNLYDEEGNKRVLKLSAFPTSFSIFSVTCAFYHHHHPILPAFIAPSLSLPLYPPHSASRRSEKHCLHPDFNL